MTIEIRPRRARDLPDLAATLVQVHAKDGYPVEGVADPEGWLHHPAALCSWTAVNDGKPIGQITLTRARTTDDAAIAWHAHTGSDVHRLTIPVRLFVHPAHRRTGAGRQLMEAAFGYAQRHGFAIAFDVMLKDRDAIRLYERLGAEQIAKITHHFGLNRTEPAAVYAMQTEQIEPGRAPLPN